VAAAGLFLTLAAGLPVLPPSGGEGADSGVVDFFVSDDEDDETVLLGVDEVLLRFEFD
jgi:hypothetical protein